MYRKILGYSSGDRKQPIYEAMPGQLITQAFIHCSQCNATVSANMGPRRDAWCIECTDGKVESDAEAKRIARKKAAAARALAKKKAADDKTGADENE